MSWMRLATCSACGGTVCSSLGHMFVHCGEHESLSIITSAWVLCKQSSTDTPAVAELR